jgi:hypothetical protein
MNYLSIEKLRTVMADWLNQYPWEYFFTGTFGGDTGEEYGGETKNIYVVQKGYRASYDGLSSHSRFINGA